MRHKKDFIPAMGYDWLTGFYDLGIKLFMPEKKFRTRLIDELQPASGETILEFGFGTGQNLILVHERNAQTTLNGVDIDPKVKAIADHKINKLGYHLPLDLYDGKTFPYGNNSFDKVFSSLVFHQLDTASKQSCLKEIYRVLKPGGILVIGDWGKARSGLMRFAFYAVQLTDGFKITNDSVKGLLPLYIDQAGFKDVTESGYINTTIGSYSYYRARK
ncbi:class I SAM-dependent methyltransferase [Chitinophaga arvensicola]|uniref:Ubiquinone/menaquinone biosynthesis C-methylase UbiE n=1 Tax=Chitinophaga arvensicola TaxID=29529 RepID=A0A1I0S9B5_9BACT|nr:class I SAM-dependent methyltransferase [Chitinophaga arvensicola]SEW52760.1 Ubiquinone/menaquinone biosynthesis C-methylase UbiE [Chitinophaga arvensicola]